MTINLYKTLDAPSISSASFKFALIAKSDRGFEFTVLSTEVEFEVYKLLLKQISEGRIALYSQQENKVQASRKLAIEIAATSSPIQVKTERLASQVFSQKNSEFDSPLIEEINSESYDLLLKTSQLELDRMENDPAFKEKTTEDKKREKEYSFSGQKNGKASIELVSLKHLKPNAKNAVKTCDYAAELKKDEEAYAKERWQRQEEKLQVLKGIIIKKDRFQYEQRVKILKAC